MENNPNVAALLQNQECPFSYQCMAVDCMDCIEIHRNGGCDSAER